MADLTSPHDRFFRATMQNTLVAQEFLQHYLPASLCDGLDFDTIKLQNNSYIDKDLQETLSDVVFDCRYKQNDDSVNKETKSETVKVVLLIEHQSTADPLMAFRTYHYMFNMLYRQLKEQPNKAQANAKLPAVYAMVFYHGQQTPYPYSMNLADSFFDPLKIMKGMFPIPVPLIDVNQITDAELKQQQFLGVITSALKYSREPDISPYMIVDLQKLAELMDLNPELALNLSNIYSHYMLIVGNIVNAKQLIQDIQHLPEPIRGKTMTAAEKLRALGREEGLEQGIEKGLEKGREEGREEGLEEGLEQVAINSLKEGVDPQFVARITGLKLTVILKLKAQLDEE